MKVLKRLSWSIFFRQLKDPMCPALYSRNVNSAVILELQRRCLVWACVCVFSSVKVKLLDYYTIKVCRAYNYKCLLPSWFCRNRKIVLDVFVLLCRRSTAQHVNSLEQPAQHQQASVTSNSVSLEFVFSCYALEIMIKGYPHPLPPEHIQSQLSFFGPMDVFWFFFFVVSLPISVFVACYFFWCFISLEGRW